MLLPLIFPGFNKLNYLENAQCEFVETSNKCQKRRLGIYSQNLYIYIYILSTKSLQLKNVSKYKKGFVPSLAKYLNSNCAADIHCFVCFHPLDTFFSDGFSIYNERINTHHITSIIKLSAVIGCRKQSSQQSFCREFISIFHYLMGTGNKTR